MKKIVAASFATAIVLVLLLSLVLPPQLLEARNKTANRSPADVGLAYQDIYFQPADEEIKLHSWWMPNPNAKAVILMVHGANGSKEGNFADSLGMYKALAAKGYSLLAIDLRNHGTSGRSDSGFLGMGFHEGPDLIAALNFIDTMAALETQTLPIYAFGLSMGGAAVIHLAEADARVRGLILFDPMLDRHSALVQGIKVSLGLPNWLGEIIVWSTESLHDLGPAAAGIASAQSLPTLLIQDEGDPVTLLEHAQALHKARPEIQYLRLDDPDPSHWIYTEHKAWGTHVGGFHFQPKVFVEEIDGFLSAQLKEISQPVSSVE